MVPSSSRKITENTFFSLRPSRWMGTHPACEHSAAHRSHTAAVTVRSPVKSPGVARDSRVLDCSFGIVVQPCRIHSS